MKPEGYPHMTLEEAFNAAEEAEREMYLNKYPKACVVLYNEIKRLKGKRKIGMSKDFAAPYGINVNPDPTYPKPAPPPNPPKAPK